MCPTASSLFPSHASWGGRRGCASHLTPCETVGVEKQWNVCVSFDSKPSEGPPRRAGRLGVAQGGNSCDTLLLHPFRGRGGVGEGWAGCEVRKVGRRRGGAPPGRWRPPQGMKSEPQRVTKRGGGSCAEVLRFNPGYVKRQLAASFAALRSAVVPDAVACHQKGDPTDFWLHKITQSGCQNYGQHWS